MLMVKMMVNEFKYLSERKEIIEPIGFFIQNDEVIIANPCSIPITFLEDSIKEHKKRKPSKTEVEICCLLKLPFKIKDLRRKKLK